MAITFIHMRTLAAQRLAQNDAEIASLKKRQEFLVRELAQNSAAIIEAMQLSANLREELNALQQERAAMPQHRQRLLDKEEAAQREALEKDGEKLRGMTGRDHGPFQVDVEGAH